MGDLTAHFSTSEALVTRRIEFMKQQRAWWVKCQPYFMTYLLDVWEPCRELVGAIYISSAIRCPELNAATPGSAEHSAHQVFMGDGRIGAATDCVPLKMTLREAYAIIATSPVIEKIDQLIIEYNEWIHIGWIANKKPRQQLLAKFEGSGFEPYNPDDPRLV